VPASGWPAQCSHPTLTSTAPCHARECSAAAAHARLLRMRRGLGACMWMARLLDGEEKGDGLVGEEVRGGSEEEAAVAVGPARSRCDPAGRKRVREAHRC